MHQLLIYYLSLPPQQKMRLSGQNCHWFFLNISLILTTQIINKRLYSALEKSWWWINIGLAYLCTPHELSFKHQLSYLDKHRVQCASWDWEDHGNENRCPHHSNPSAASHSQAFIPWPIYATPICLCHSQEFDHASSCSNTFLKMKADHWMFLWNSRFCCLFCFSGVKRIKVFTFPILFA